MNPLFGFLLPSASYSGAVYLPSFSVAGAMVTIDMSVDLLVVRAALTYRGNVPNPSAWPKHGCLLYQSVICLS